MSIEQWQQPAPVEAATGGPTSRLVEWAKEADAAYQLAQRLTTTTFCPESFRGKPADAAAAMLAGGALGLSPLAALGAFDVISGRAAARAITLRALVQSKGHEMVLVESTNTRCRMKGKRAGSNEWQTVTWTMDRARDLGLTGKKNWKEQPQAMLQARATSELARLIAADAILGIGGGLTAEELSDGSTTITATTVEEPAPVESGWPVGTRRMSRPKKDTDPDPDPVQDPPEAEPEAPTDEPEPITPAQLKKLHTLLTKQGITDRADGLAFYQTILDREVESSKDLTKAEANRIIDALERADRIIDIDAPEQDDIPVEEPALPGWPA
jgi:hypothetical protein